MENQKYNCPVRILQSVGTMNHGGIEHFVMNLYRNIDRSKVQFDFVYRVSEECVFDEEIRSLGGRIYKFQSPDKHPKEAESFYRNLFSGNREIIAVHEHRTDVSGHLACIKAAKQAGVPVRIVHSHNSKPMDSYAGPAQFLRTAWHYLNRTTLGSLVTSKMACSDLAAEWMFGKSSDCTLVNNGVDVGSFRYDSDLRAWTRRELGIPENAFVVGNVGRVAPQKNQVFLLDILKALPLDVDPHLLIVGDGPLMPALRERAQTLGINARVHFAGMQSETSRFYSAMDILCMPSIFEGLPVSSIEAQSSGLPILFSDRVSRLSSVIECNEFLPLEEDAGCWASTLIRLRSEAGDRSLAMGLMLDSGFDISSTIDQLLPIYLSKTTATIV